MTYVLPFDAGLDPQEVGGKAHGLHRLVEWGLDVPAGVAVTAAAYRDGVAGTMAGQIANTTADSSPDNLESLRRAISEVDLPPVLDEELGAAWSMLTSLSEGPLAVSCRSSAIGEDSQAASFAGQHATILGITNLDSLRQAVRDCWASLWTPGAAAYRSRAGITDPAMALVVQQMVRADVSGVAFSVNPVTGDPGQVVINSTYGLGEMVVSGAITPDTYIVDKQTGALMAAEVSPDKSRQLVVSADGAVHEEPVSPALWAAPSINDQLVSEISSAAVRAEQKSGTPQDVEWAVESGRLFLLQSRPITTV